MSSSVPTSGRASKRWVLVLTLALAGGGVATYYLLRPAAPPLPNVDLTDVDPEVAATVTAAMDAVKADPRNGAAWGKLGMVFRAHDFDMASVEALQAAERFDPENPKWPYLQGLTLVLFDPEAGLACLERAANRSPANSREPKLRLAEVLLDRGRVADAEAVARPVGDRWPDDPRAAIVLARAAAERGDWAAVLARTDPVRSDPSARRRAAILRADALRRLGRDGEANAEATRFAGLPEDETWDDQYVRETMALQVGGDAELRRGATLLGTGELQDAVASLELAVAKSRNPMPARLLLARAHNESRNPLAARRVLEDVFKADPNAVEGWFQLGVAQVLSDDPKAAASFERVVQLKPDHALAYFNLGVVRQKRGDKPGAQAAFEAALRCRPDYEPASKALAELRTGK